MRKIGQDEPACAINVENCNPAESSTVFSFKKTAPYSHFEPFARNSTFEDFFERDDFLILIANFKDRFLNQDPTPPHRPPQSK